MRLSIKHNRQNLSDYNLLPQILKIVDFFWNRPNNFVICKVQLCQIRKEPNLFRNGSRQAIRCELDFCHMCHIARVIVFATDSIPSAYFTCRGEIILCQIITPTTLAYFSETEENHRNSILFQEFKNIMRRIPFKIKPVKCERLW